MSDGEHRDEPGSDWLDAMLRDDVYIEDAGFSARVMETLPPPRPVRRRRRNLVLLLSAALGSALALFVLPGGEVLTRAFMDALKLGFQPSAQNVSLLSLAVLGLVAAGSAAVVRGSTA